MTIPYAQKFFPIVSPEEKLTRSIDNHYHLSMVADNSYQIVEYQAQSLKLQHETAMANLRGLETLVGKACDSNDLLESLNTGVERGLSQLGGTLENLRQTVEDALVAVTSQSEQLAAGLETVAESMIEQKQTLNRISDVLSSPYETHTRELLAEAEVALKSGMQATGRDRVAEFTDASKLLRNILENPIGGRNYVAWFQLGWLQWKFQEDCAAAEESFYHAARLSGARGDIYYGMSLRHMAYMQYAQGRYVEAYESAAKSVGDSGDDADALFDLARYAARAGKETEAAKHLGFCIDIRPQTIVTMFAETDFQSITPALAGLVLQKTRQARDLAIKEVAEWRNAVHLVKRIERQAGVRILSLIAMDETAAVRREADAANFTEACSLRVKAALRRAETLAAATPALESTIRAATERLSQAEKALDSLKTQRRCLADRRKEALVSQAERRFQTDTAAAQEAFDAAFKAAPEIAAKQIKKTTVERFVAVLGKHETDREKALRDDLISRHRGDAKRRLDDETHTIKTAYNDRVKQIIEEIKRQEANVRFYPEMAEQAVEAQAAVTLAQSDRHRATEALQALSIELEQIERDQPTPSDFRN